MTKSQQGSLNDAPQCSPLLRLQGVSKQYQTAGQVQHVLRGIDFTLLAEESLALMGDSGSGKSTLLHLIAALDKPDSGEIWFDGQAVHNLVEREANLLRRHAISVVFQQFNLIPTLTARDNILFPRRLLKLPETDPLVNTLIERMQLQGLLDRYPEQLSGGQQQRVAIARALVHRPRLVLADEPTGNLDEAMSHQVMQLMTELASAQGSSLLLVTHSREMASYLPRQIRLHEGRIDAPAAVDPV